MLQRLVDGLKRTFDCCAQEGKKTEARAKIDESPHIRNTYQYPPIFPYRREREEEGKAAYNMESMRIDSRAGMEGKEKAAS